MPRLRKPEPQDEFCVEEVEIIKASTQKIANENVGEDYDYHVSISNIVNGHMYVNTVVITLFVPLDELPRYSINTATRRALIQSERERYERPLKFRLVNDYWEEV